MARTLSGYEQETIINFNKAEDAVKGQVRGNTTRMTAKRLQNKPQQATGRVKGLTIGQDWRVGADALNIILYRRQVNKKTGKEYWRAHSYFSTVKNALEYFAQTEVNETGLKDLATVVKKQDEILRTIRDLPESLLNSQFKSLPFNGK